MEGGIETGREDTMWINLREEITALEGEEWKEVEIDKKETISEEVREKEEGGKEREKAKEGQVLMSGERVKMIREVKSGRIK